MLLRETHSKLGRTWSWLGARAGGYFAYFEADEAADGDVFAEFGDGLGDHFADGDAFVLDVVLLVEAVFFVELFHFAGGDFLHHGFGLAGGQCLRLVDFLFLGEHFRRDFFTTDVARVQRGDMHGDIVRKLDERIGAGHEIGFAIQFDEHTDFSAGVDVAADEAFGGFASGFLGGRGLAFFSQDADGFFDVAIGFDEGGAAVRETGVGAFAQLFDELGGNVGLAGAGCVLMFVFLFSLI